MSKPALQDEIPFRERLSCTIGQACEATGLGRSKIYMLMGEGLLKTTRVGRRRLVLVGSLLALVEPPRTNQAP